MSSGNFLVVATGNVYEKFGMFNAILNRTKHLSQIHNSAIDVILLSSYDSILVRKLRGTLKREKVKEQIIDGVKFQIFWKPYTLVEHVLSVILHCKSPFKDKRIPAVLKIIENKEYDFIVAHSLLAGEIALAANRLFNIPFSVTWHGSDIHTLPMNSTSTFERTKLVLEGANINYFVSCALRKESRNITSKGNKEILYNGCDIRFFRYSESQRAELRDLYNVRDRKVVSFVGGFIDIKNILLVPLIFSAIYKKDKNVVFWLFGDGKYRGEVEKLLDGLPAKLWGMQPPELMPQYLNCTNVQILPSKNEGLPLTMVEALRCGCHAVGSLVGGIPEVIGVENCIPLDSPTFVQDIVDRVLYFLNEGESIKQPIPPHFDWRVSAKKESEYIKTLLN